MTVYTNFLSRFVLVLNLEHCFRIVDILAVSTLSFAGPGRILVSSSVLVVWTRVIYYLVIGSSKGLSRVL
jgi:hypothetical protein